MKKQVYFIFTTLIISLASFYLLKIALIGEYKNIFLIIPGLLILPIGWGVCSLLFENVNFVLISTLISALIFLILWGIQVPYLICATLMIISMIWGYRRVKKEKTLRIKIAAEDIIPKGIDWLFMVMALIISVGFYYSPKGQELKNGLKIPLSMEEKVMSMAVPGFNQNLTLDQTLNLIIKKDKDTLLSNQARDQILEQLGLDNLNLNGKEIIAQNPEILDKLTLTKVNQFLRPFSDYLPIAAGVLIFQLLVWINRILLHVAVFFSLIIYAALRAAKVVKIEKITTEKEKLML
ncbi:MAG: hypothetical protein NT135_00455 [Candidatus Berkelbacteria bacterium]|nr:hypothetical protein [Candidatus Berkelbacteria bacterium]